LTVCAYNGWMTKAQQSNAIAPLDIDIKKLKRVDLAGNWLRMNSPSKVVRDSLARPISQPASMEPWNHAYNTICTFQWNGVSLGELEK